RGGAGPRPAILPGFRAPCSGIRKPRYNVHVRVAAVPPSRRHATRVVHRISGNDWRAVEAGAGSTGRFTTDHGQSERDRARGHRRSLGLARTLRRFALWLPKPSSAGISRAELHRSGQRLGGTPGPPGAQRRGALWDVLSTRFATGLSGDVVGVHAYPEGQHEALTRGPLANNTYNTVEKPAVAAIMQPAGRLRHRYAA